MIDSITMGVLLGFSAGISPGPLLALVFSETLRFGRGAGIRVSLAPLATDVPIVGVALFVLRQLARFELLLGGISLVGAGVVLWLGVENMRLRPMNVSAGPVQSWSLLKGMVVNAVSPHPYLFWFSVGGPIFWKTWDHRPAFGLLFLLCFYLLLIGSKIGLALIVSRSRSLLTGRPYRLLLRILGSVLIGFAILLAGDGLSMLGLI